MRRGSVFLHEPGTSPSFLNPHMCHIVDSLDRVSSSRQPPDSHVDRVYCTHGRPWTDRRGRDAQMVYCMWQAWLRSECEVRVNYSTCTVQHIHVVGSYCMGRVFAAGRVFADSPGGPAAGDPCATSSSAATWPASRRARMTVIFGSNRAPLGTRG